MLLKESGIDSPLGRGYSSVRHTQHAIRLKKVTADEYTGNLPTEKVTKRDLFHVFHKHGKLAQISIKQAYGFVQFLEAASCHAALAAEQGEIIRGRKIREQPNLTLIYTPIDWSQTLRSPSLKKVLGTLERLIGQQFLGGVRAHQNGGEAPDRAVIGSIAQATPRGFLSAITEMKYQDGETSTDLCGPLHLVDTVHETTIGYATGVLLSKSLGKVSP